MTRIPGISGNWRKVDSRHGMNLYESVEYGRNVPMLVVDDSGNLIKETRGSLSVAMGDRHERKSVFASANRRSKGPVVSGNRRGGFLGTRNVPSRGRPVDMRSLAVDILAYSEMEHYDLVDNHGFDRESALDGIMRMLQDPVARGRTMAGFKEQLEYDEAIDFDLALSIHDRLNQLDMYGGYRWHRSPRRGPGRRPPWHPMTLRGRRTGPSHVPPSVTCATQPRWDYPP